MKMFKLKLEVDLSNPAVVAAMHTLFTAVGGLAESAITAGHAITKMVETVKAPEPEVKTKAEKAPRKVKETFDDKAPEPNPDEVENGDVTIQMVRDVLATKIDANRDTIKAKLTELGAKNVTLLDAKHYPAMYEFLNGLK